MSSATMSGRKYPPKNRKAKRPWSESETMVLIKGYETNECLWYPKTRRHRNRNLVTAAWNSIARKTDHCVDDVKAQWNNVKTRFNLERRKELSKQQVGITYRPTWPFYQSMLFMAQTVTETRNTISNLKSNPNETTSSIPSPKSLDHSLGDEAFTFSNVAPNKRRREAQPASPAKQPRLTFIEQCMALLQDNEKPRPVDDEWTTVGNFVAAELRSRTRSTALRMKRKLFKVIMEEQFNEDDVPIYEYEDSFMQLSNEDDTEYKTPR